MDWDDIPNEPYYSARTRVQLRNHLQAMSPRRWRRLQKEYGWVRDEMKKMGLNPEDARFLL